MNYVEQIKKNERIKKELEKLEKERIKTLKTLLGAQVRLSELKHELALKRREFKIVAFRRSPFDLEKKRAFVKKKGKCKECDSVKNLTVHHKKSLSEGGTHAESNLEVLCLKCHRKHHPIDKRAVIRIDIDRKLGG